MATEKNTESILALLRQAYTLDEDVWREVEAILEDGIQHPLTDAEIRSLLSRSIEVIREAATRHNDTATLNLLEGRTESVVERILSGRLDTRKTGQANMLSRKTGLQLESFNGIAGPVKPTPVFHGKEVEMRRGFVRTKDIALWDLNERLQIHLGQFQHQNSRMPNSAEVLDIMLGKLKLPGLEEKDHFEIETLARSIAINGVQKPPIIDTDGTLLDGNRRVAACHLILSSGDFTTEQKKRAEHILVWQLTEFATDEDRRLVVIALNFEPDCKQNWPEYVKAKKVTEEWRSMLQLEPHHPGPSRQAEIKRDLSVKFALGPETRVVNRYIKMVEWAEDFEDYLVNTKGEDEHVVRHRANRYFQYFDELAKGDTDGVAYVLKNNDGFRHMVFDLLFQGKFKNWRQIRELRYIHENEEAQAQLRKAHDAKVADEDEWEECIDNAITIARSRRAENRTLGVNTRIETFVSWLEDLPVKAFRDEMKPENLRRLLRALKLVEKHANSILERL